MNYLEYEKLPTEEKEKFKFGFFLGYFFGGACMAVIITFLP